MDSREEEEERRVTPWELEQAVYKGVKRALYEFVGAAFVGFVVFWVIYQYGGTVLSVIGAGLLRLIGG
jgi:hypothetical protein